MWNSPNDFFDDNQCIMGDSAFENKWFCVSAFTAPPGEEVGCNESKFNSCLSKARVISEHTIGLLKGRFPWLRTIRKVITDNKKTLKEILAFMDASVVIHNFLVKRGLDEAKEEWLDDDDASAVDDYQRLPADDELNQPVPQGTPGDFRRTQLLHCSMETGTVLQNE